METGDSLRIKHIILIHSAYKAYKTLTVSASEVKDLQQKKDVLWITINYIRW